MENVNVQPAWTIVSEVELIYKSKIKASARPVIKSSRDAYQLITQLWNSGTLELFEEFKALFISRSNRVLAAETLGRGGLTGTVVDIRLLFATALKIGGCTNIMVCHNHPSGNLQPSRADEELTQKILQAGKFLDIRLRDHIIISSEGYYSFADEGLL